jgi:predicted kinase
MDLDFLGLPALSERFARAYAERAGDADLASLLPFYQCYRAVVRGKVETLRSREPEVEPEARQPARLAAQRYFRLAERYTRGRRPPEIIVVYGFSGTGKSTVARMVCDLTGFAIVNSDVVRKELAGMPRRLRPDAALSRWLYSGPVSRRTYEELTARARSALDAGRGVILDATYLEPAHRSGVAALGAERGVPVVFVECRADEVDVRRRLRERHGRGDEVSDAGEEIYLRQRGRRPRLQGGTSGRYASVDTARDLETIAHDLERLLGIA